MKRISIHLATLILFLACCHSTELRGQNPLRNSSQTFGRQSTPSQTTSTQLPARDAATQERTTPFLDNNVEMAAYQEPTADPNQTRQPVLSNSSQNTLPGNQNFIDVVSNISMNLVFVLCFALGILLLAKKYFKPNATTTSSNNNTEEANTLRIRHCLKLDNRTSIRVVQWRTNRFLIACDQNGIQSVHPLNPTFGQTLDEMDDQTLDTRTVKILLNELDSKAA